ncbi:MAG: xanthine dehydrogenase family protein subunit M [Alphaproteobacteria bacterium]|nr:MAG: xanthine dehydrogenase family protein subunit M [Alphaproteobacteria bacterium]
MKAPRFSYVRAQSLDHVLQLLAEHGDEARILAGGQSLIPVLNMRLSQPKLLIDINRIEPLKGISRRDGSVRIGALARHVEVMSSSVVQDSLPLIAEAMPHVAHVAVRNRGTFGGSIALADPSAELPACIVALAARVVVQSTRGRRAIAADEFFLDLYETARKPDELLVEVLIPEQEEDWVSVFMELARRHGDFAIAGLACYARCKDEMVNEARLVYFGSEVKPTLAVHAMAALARKQWTPALSEVVSAALGDDLDPIDNIFGSPATKLHLQRVLTRRALDKAVQRAKLQ